MSTVQQLVVAVFRNRAQAEQAINELLQANFDDDQIRFAGHEATAGGMLEKIKSLFTGQVPMTGGSNLYNDLVDMGVPSRDAQYYQGEYDAGHSIVGALAGTRAQEASMILIRNGGYGADQAAAQAASAGTAGAWETGTQQTTAGTAGPSGEARVAGAAGAAGMRQTSEEEQRLKLREEELQARKQTVEKGEVRVRKEVVTEQKSIDVPVTREEVYVERRPGSGQPSDVPISEGETYRIPVREEEVIVEKHPVEREEVILGKQPVEETRRVSETVQREEAHVEHEGDIDFQGRARGAQGPRRGDETDIQGRARDVQGRRRRGEGREARNVEDIQGRDDIIPPHRDIGGSPGQPSP